MAASKTSAASESKEETPSEESAQPKAPKADPKNPSGASDEQIKKGEMAGKVRLADVDSSYHAYEFTDPYTGEPVETKQVIHDVPTGVNDDGSVKTEKGDKVFTIQGEGKAGEGVAATTGSGADSAQSAGANQGEAGEVKPESGKAPK